MSLTDGKVNEPGCHGHRGAAGGSARKKVRLRNVLREKQRRRSVLRQGPLAVRRAAVPTQQGKRWFAAAPRRRRCPRACGEPRALRRQHLDGFQIRAARLGRPVVNVLPGEVERELAHHRRTDAGGCKTTAKQCRSHSAQRQELQAGGLGAQATAGACSRAHAPPAAVSAAMAGAVPVAGPCVFAHVGFPKVVTWPSMSKLGRDQVQHEGFRKGIFTSLEGDNCARQ